MEYIETLLGCNPELSADLRFIIQKPLANSKITEIVLKAAITSLITTTTITKENLVAKLDPIGSRFLQLPTQGSTQSKCHLSKQVESERKRKGLDKEAAELLISKRRRLHSTLSDSNPFRSWPEIADIELVDYLKIVEKGLFEAKLDSVVFWLGNATIDFPFFIR